MNAGDKVRAVIDGAWTLIQLLAIVATVAMIYRSAKDSVNIRNTRQKNEVACC
jgi:hypothetical protein